MVVARYKESLSWIDKYKDKGFSTIHIYSKSDKDISCPKFETTPHTKCVIHKVKNVGVCDHTYLYHIVHNYDNLADVTLFAPGSADMEFKTKILDSTIKRLFEVKNTVINVFRFDVGAGEAMYNFKMDKYPTAYSDNRDGEVGEVPQTLSEVRPFGEWYAKNFPGEQPKEASFFGIMAVSKEHIHQKPKSFYENLLKQVDKDKFHEVAHFIERSYPAIFYPLPQEAYDTPTIVQMKIGADHGGYAALRR